MSDRLNQRSRLMALVFALRLTLTGLFFLAGSIAVVPLNLTADRQLESLLILFSIFLLAVALVLCFIRFKRHANRLLLLAPFFPLALPAVKAQFVGALIGLAVSQEGFRREASELRAGTPFGVCLALYLASAMCVWMELPSPLLAVVLLSATVLTFAYGCWTWQNRLKEDMTRFDVD